MDCLKMAEEQKYKEDKEEKNDVFPFIEGKTIDLVAGNSKWANLFCSWINNPKVRHYSRIMWPQTLEEVKKGSNIHRTDVFGIK